MNILYLRANFPKLSETFILEEVLALRRRGHEVRVVGAICEFERLHHKVLEERVFELVEYDGRFLGAPAEFDEFIRSRDSRYVNRAFVLRNYFKNPLHVSKFRLLGIFLKQQIKPKSFKGKFTRLRDVLAAARRLNNIWLALYQLRPRPPFVPDVIHCPFSTIHNLAYAKEISDAHGGIPYTVSFRAKDLYTMYETEPQIRRELISSCAKVMTIAKFNRIALAERYPHLDDVPVIHSSIDTEYFSPGKNAEKSRNQVIAVGRLIEKKGFEYLIDSCWRLKKAGTAFRCSIIGEGPWETQLRSRVMERGVSDCVEILGPLIQHEIRSRLDQAEVFVLPCITGEDLNRDILANAIKEAMAMALPVITSDLNGIGELIDDGINGILVRPRDSAELAEKINFIFEHRELGRELGRKARERILEQFSSVGETAKLEAIFMETIAASK